MWNEFYLVAFGPRSWDWMAALANAGLPWLLGLLALVLLMRNISGKDAAEAGEQ